MIRGAILTTMNETGVGHILLLFVFFLYTICFGSDLLTHLVWLALVNRDNVRCDYLLVNFEVGSKTLITASFTVADGYIYESRKG